PFVLRSFFVTARIRVGLGLVMSRHDQGHWSWSGNKYRSAETELLSENSQLKVQAAQLQDTVQHLKETNAKDAQTSQARRQEYSAKIALMTAKLQDTDGKLDLSTELARERKAQIADLQRQNKDLENKLKDAQQRA
ncbi:unnamed protein product, partial [Effrenium voratum]